MLDIRSDEYYMRLAIKQAELAAQQNEVPIGAVIVHNNEVIARAYNQVEMLKDATAHAEIIAITSASASLGNWRLNECTLYVTKEPCPMCAGALVNSRIQKVVFGIHDKNGGGAGGSLNITGHKTLLHNVEVKGGVLEFECLEQLQDFFQRRRQESKEKKKIDPDPPNPFLN